MLQKLSSSRSFEVLNAPSYRIAIGEIESKFWDWMAVRPVAKRCHEDVAMPFKRALEKAGAPSLRYSVEGKKGADYYFLELGGQIFPMRVRKKEYNPTELTLFPPLAPKDFKVKAFD